MSSTNVKTKNVLEKRTYTVTEAAQIIGVSRSLAYQMANEGKLPVIPVGIKKKVVPKEALEKWLTNVSAVSI